MVGNLFKSELKWIITIVFAAGAGYSELQTLKEQNEQIKQQMDKEHKEQLDFNNRVLDVLIND